MEHTKIVQEQFERQGEIYATMAQVQDTKGHQAIVQACGTDASQRVLDVACGPGFLTRQFASVAGEVVGIDVTNKFLTMAAAAAKKDGLSNLSFQQGDVNELPFEAASFDIVCCRAAFHHFPQPERVLSEMSRVLKPGGTIAIVDLIVSEDKAKANYHNKMEVLIDPSHARGLPLSEFRTLLANAGLEVLHTFESQIDSSMEDWIAHGAPAESVADEIRALVGAAISNDLTDLNVRVEDGKVRLTHKLALLVAYKPT